MGYKKRKQKGTGNWIIWLITALICLAVISSIAVYALPFVAYYQITTAIIHKDAGKLASFMDMQTLRNNLKMQRGQRMIKILKNDQDHPVSLVDLAIHWSSLNSDGEVERAVSTEGLYVAMTGTGSAVKIPQADREPLTIAKKMIEDSSFHYRSFSDFVINVKDKRGRYVEYFSFSLHREGLTWRLSNVLLPVV